MKKQLIFTLFFVSSFSGLQIKSADKLIKMGKFEEETRPPFLGREDIPTEIEEKILSMVAGSDDFWSQSKNLTNAARTSKGHLQELIPNYLVRVLLQSGKTPDQLFLEGLYELLDPSDSFNKGSLNTFGFNILKKTFKDFDEQQALASSGKTIDQLFLKAFKNSGTIDLQGFKTLKEIFKDFDAKKILEHSYNQTINEILLGEFQSDSVISSLLNRLSILIKLGADNVNIRDQTWEQTPLIFASKRGNNTLVNLLIEKGAKLDLKNKYGNTALMLASDNGHTATVDLLLQKGADPDIKDEGFGYTALMLASRKGHTDIINLLLQKGANPDIKTVFGETYKDFLK